jgi:large subunit ribosomal protein L3
VLQGIIGKKIGMTQVFNEDGHLVPVTVIQAGPCQVVRTKTKDKDGYEAIQVGYDEIKPKLVNKPDLGQFTKRGLKPYRILREFHVSDASQYQVGQEIKSEVLKDLVWVDVIGTSKGKGFQGVMKRHHSHGGPGGHGSMFHRAPGSMGASSQPSRTLKNRVLPGHMGDVRVTAQKLKLVSVDTENNLVLIRGSVPGGKRGVVIILKSKKA